MKKMYFRIVQSVWNRKLLLLNFLFVFVEYAAAQGTWWNTINQWDRVTPWERYLTPSPGFMGPNAFPVPEIENGLLEKQLTLETAVEGHFNRHEQTENLYTRLFIPFKNQKVGIQLFLVPFEIYSYDQFIRDQRSSTDYDGQGVASGDLYIGTAIQLIENRKWLPDALLSINIKTASGNQYGAARFSDSPGYFFDLSFGKSVYFNSSHKTWIRFYTLVGFYSWHTNLAAHFQDEAVVYGIGAGLELKYFSLNQNFGGFSGFLNNGDRPQVYRVELSSKSNRSVNYKIRFQYGFKDIDYRSIRFSMIYNLKQNQ
ncbi:MAG TPA: hypothetical protein DCG69_04845 [Bacteroidales bacterium]|nr:hypothetical protein [Bacteroidales bacterium]